MGERIGRECVRCALDPGYNRAVVDVVSGIEIGSLCRNCEAATLETYATDGHDESRECTRCDRDGFIALPKWLPRATLQDGVIVSSVEYRVDEAAICLCDEHFHELTTGGEEERPERYPRNGRQ